MFVLRSLQILFTVVIATGDYISDHVVYHCPGSVEQARQLAEDHNLVYVSEVFPGSHMHHALLPSGVTDDPGEGCELNTRQYQFWDTFSNDPRVSWVERQVYQPRETRFLTVNAPRLIDAGTHEVLNSGRQDVGITFNDPYFPNQWYLHGRGRLAQHLDVVPVWNQGYSGRGVYLSVLDDTVNANNPDIGPNFDPSISGDLSELSKNDGQEKKKNPLHGTYCASVIAGVANNSICGVGVAFNAKVGGVRLLMKKKVLDVQEAKALNFHLNRVHIYSASWGPPDDGSHIGAPGVLASRALIRGVTEGRNGLGAIYVWASGNGGMKGDNCGFDNYASSIYTLTVSALTSQGLSPFYAEHCPAALTSVYVGGKHLFPRSIADLERASRVINVIAAEGSGSCTTTFQGTSAAAPLAAGIIALLLEANPKLTWRDVQHLAVRSSFPTNAEAGWSRNGAGFMSHPFYGFGALNATALVNQGRNWTNVPPQKSFTVTCSDFPALRPLTPNKPVVFYIPMTADMTSLEYVKATFTAKTNPRGALDVAVKSPTGFLSRLLLPRKMDNSTEAFQNWSTASAQFWGETPTGLWAFIFTNVGDFHGYVASCSLTFYGY